jgi:hypothetical protein
MEISIGLAILAYFIADYLQFKKRQEKREINEDQ